MKYPISKLGRYQLRDIDDSHDIVMHDAYARICRVSHSKIKGDRSSIRMANLFGGKEDDYDYQFVIQIAGCPFRCWYCYVDNLKKDISITAQEIVKKFLGFRCTMKSKYDLPLNVLHIMGGCPGAHPKLWVEAREILDGKGMNNVIIYSDVIFVERYWYRTTPWEFMNIKNFILAGCLKGVNPFNFMENCESPLFYEALDELQKYVEFPNFYLTLINPDIKPSDTLPFETKGLKSITANADILEIVEDYAVVKARKRGLIE